MSFKNKGKNDVSNNVDLKNNKLDNDNNTQIRDSKQCQYCQLKCRTPGDLKMHLRVHTGEKPFACSVCQKEFTTMGNCNAHAFRIHGIPIKNRRERNQGHGFQRARKNVKKYTCEFCSKNYNRPSKLREHLSVHAVEKPYLCEVCKCSFRRRDTLKIHMRIHTGEKPYKCNLCKMSFAQRSTLLTHNHTKQHLSKLAGAKMFACNVCGKLFNKNSNLTVHLRIHTGEKPYVCMHCSERFSCSRYLKVHLDTCMALKKTHNSSAVPATVQEFAFPLINAFNVSNEVIISKEERARQWEKFIVVFNAKIVGES